ncbi:hypothetical protein [Streptomyces sp. NPDC052114]|uniref:hypothetical protein n=1 Tax=unclassified Streptomyces TaxID=2593676 RepID=UPI00342852ED
MSEQQPEPPDLTPQPNQIIAKPATVEACQDDYADAAAVCLRMAQQDAVRRRA